MNAFEIEQAVSELAERPFDREEFPFQFLAAIGNKDDAETPSHGRLEQVGCGRRPSDQLRPHRYLRARANPFDPCQSPPQCGFRPSESAVQPFD